MNDIDFAWKVAEGSHKGQLYNGEDYIIAHIHPIQLTVSKLSKFTKRLIKKCRIVAIMHDSLEDSNLWTLNHLRSCFDDNDIIDALDAITKRKDEDYFNEYLPRLSKNKIASIVKEIDIQENLSNSLWSGNKKFIEKYTKALEFIQEKNNENI